MVRNLLTHWLRRDSHTRRSPRCFRPALTMLEDRTIPAVTSAVFSGGTVSVICDNQDDDLFMIINGNGTFSLLDHHVSVSISGAPTVGTVNAIVIQTQGGADRVDLGRLPAGRWSVVVDGGDGNDSLIGGASADLLIGNVGNDSLFGNSGDDVLDGRDGEDDLRGGAGNDHLFGDGGNDRLDGGAGDDYLEGNDGADQLTGGFGDDVIEGGPVFDFPIEDKVVEIIGGNATVSEGSLVGVGVDELRGIEAIELYGTTAANVLDASGFFGRVFLSGGNGNDLLIGGQSTNSLVGGAGNDTLIGNGFDTLVGEQGNDSLVGNEGDDSLSGGDGSDTIDGGAGADLLFESPTLHFTLTDTSASGFGSDKLAGVERAQITGSAAANKFIATNFSGAVTLLGGAGNDTLSGGKGADVLTGGAGRNLIDGGLGVDTDVETFDTAMTLTNTRLTAGTLATNTLTSVEQARLTGDAAANKIDASAFTLGPVSLNGAGGNDTLTGTSKDDTLTGGLGTDVLDGRGGTDAVAEFGNADFTLTVVGANGSLIGTAGFNTDALANVERGQLTGGDGNNVMNASQFNAGPVTLIGGGGNDTLTGTTFDDILTGGTGSNTLSGNTGNDTVLETTAGAVTLSNASLTFADGNDSLTSVETAQLTGTLGGAFFDVSGWTGKATLESKSSFDVVVSTNDLDFALTSTTLSRSDGASFTLLGIIPRVVLTGGAGNNAFDLTGFPGTVNVNGGGGDDVLILTRDADMTLTDSAVTFDDGSLHSLNGIRRAILTGGAGKNLIDAALYSGTVTLNGGAGDDTLFGGSGDDTLDGGADFDFLDGGAGTDIALNGEELVNFP